MFGPLNEKRLDLAKDEHLLKSEKVKVEGVPATLTLTDQRILVTGHKGTWKNKADPLFDIPLHDLEDVQTQGTLRKGLHLRHALPNGSTQELDLQKVANPKGWDLVIRKAQQATNGQGAKATTKRDAPATPTGTTDEQA